MSNIFLLPVSSVMSLSFVITTLSAIYCPSSLESLHLSFPALLLDTYIAVGLEEQGSRNNNGIANSHLLSPETEEATCCYRIQDWFHSSTPCNSQSKTPLFVQLNFRLVLEKKSHK